MATLLDGYTQNWKHLTVDLSKQWKLTDSQIETMNKYGYTYSYINEPTTSGSSNTSTPTNTNSTYNPPANTGGSSGWSSGGGWKTIEPPKTWENYWSKMNNPSEISKYLNGQSGFSTRVLWDRIVGTKNGVKKVWKFDGSNWVAEDQKGWDYYAKLSDPAEVAFYLNSQDGFNVKTAGSKISGTKNWVETTWSFDGANWVPSATATDTVTKNGASGNSGSFYGPWYDANGQPIAWYNNGKTMSAGPNKDLPATEDSPKDEPAQDWGTYGTMPDASAVTTYLNTQPGFNTYVARDPVSNEIVPNKIEGTKNGVKTSWTFDGSNWVSDQGDTSPGDMQAGAVTTENITTAQLNKLIADRGLDPAKFTGKQKSAYDRLVIKAQENDKKASETTDGPDEWDTLSDTEKTIENMLDEKKDVNQLLIDTAKEWVKILKEKIENITKPMEEEYQKLSTEWWNQEVEFQKQFEKQWADVERYENESRSAIKELEDLGRKQYKDYVSRVARVVSGRKAAISGELSAQGFNANIIGNIASQIDTQYADERLKVQTFLSDVLDKSLSRQRDLYTDLFNRRSSLTAAQQSFRTVVGERYKYLSSLKQRIGEITNTMFEPIENINKTLTGAYTPVETSAATSEAYEQEWKQGDEQKRISQLSSQLHNFLGKEMKADGTPKYDTNKIPTDKLAEFAKLPTAAEAYRAAVDYLTAQGGETTTPAAATTPAASSTSTGKASTGAKSTGASDTNAAQTTGKVTSSLDATKKYLLDQAKLLNEKGGFAKTSMSYEAFAQQVNNAKTDEDIKKLAASIDPAVNATPAVKETNDLAAKKQEAFAPYGKLSEAQKTLIKKSPLMKDVLAITQEIQALTKDDQRFWDLGTLNRARMKMQKVVDAALAGKTSVDLTTF